MTSSVRTRSSTKGDRVPLVNALTLLPNDDVSLRVEAEPGDNKVDSEIMIGLVAQVGNESAVEEAVIVNNLEAVSAPGNVGVKSHKPRFAASNRTKSSRTTH